MEENISRTNTTASVSDLTKTLRNLGFAVVRQTNALPSSHAFLTPGEVKRIRILYRQGWTQSELAEAFYVSRSQVGRIVRRENWSWLN